MGRHRHHRGEQRRVGRPGDVVGGADEQRVGEVGLVGQLVEPLGHRLAARRQAEVDDGEALLDRPLEGRREEVPAAAVVGAQDPDGHEVRGRRDGVDDPGAGRPVADHVGRVRIVDDAGDVAVAGLDAEAPHEPAADSRVIRRPRPSR